MGLITRMARRLAAEVAEQVAGRARTAELFEKPGERAPSGPPAGSEDREEAPLAAPVDDGLFDAPDPVTVETERVESEAVNKLDAVELGAGVVRVVDLDQLKATLANAQRPVVVHHWATWCEACVEELPDVDTLVERLGDTAQVLGVSWELFERSGQEEFEVVGGVAKYATDQGLAMPTLIYRGEPASLFAGLALDFEQIPQTRVFDALGNELRAFKGPMSGEDLAAVAELVAPTP